MRRSLFILSLTMMPVLLSMPAEAQYRGGNRGFMPRPSPQLFYNGVTGYSQFGWELGRMQSMRRYGTDPGSYPGLRRALGW